MRLYELTVIFPVEEDRHRLGRERLLADFANYGVEIVKADEAGDRDLAYEVKKNRRGKYVFFVVKVEPDKVATLDRIFKLNANLLKYFFVNIED